MFALMLTAKTATKSIDPITKDELSATEMQSVNDIWWEWKIMWEQNEKYDTFI